VHQDGFSLRDYVEMHGQQNIKLSVLFTLLYVTVRLGMCLFGDICFGIRHINNNMLLMQYYALTFKHEIYTFTRTWLCIIGNVCL
jgi:hypothetical protein